MRTFSPKDPGETIVLGFNFAPDLNAGETLTGSPTISLGQYSGTPDPSMPSMIVGAAQTSGSLVLQTVTMGMSGNNYSVTGTCPTSAGRILAVGGILPCLAAYLQ
jgi:hypothetical protein